ncbi:6230_t:CDS:2, partial [Scutellospora calospora]
DKIHYIKKKWINVSLCPSDRVLTKNIKALHEISTMDLLLETLICEAKINNNNNASESFEIPTDFLVIKRSKTTSLIEWQKLKYALHLHSNEESSVLTTPRITKKEKNRILMLDFSSVYDDLKTSIERDAKGNVVSRPMRHQNLEDACKLNCQIHLFKPKAEQIQIPLQPSDRRRGCINLSCARHGLRVEDPLSNS